MKNSQQTNTPGLASLVLLCCASLCHAAPRDAGVSTSTTHYESSGKQVTIDVFSPAGRAAGKKLPAVILLHGADGITTPFLDYRKYAKELAARGYVVLVPHYFESTVSTTLDPTKFWTGMAKNAPVWLKAAGDAVSYAARQPEIDEKRIGLLGFSLGSYLSIYVAATDKRVAAVVEYFGGIFPGVDQLLSKRPPILILHGDADKIVSVDEARKLATACTEADVDCEMKIYKGQGHGFFGPADEDARKRTADWFDTKMPG